MSVFGAYSHYYNLLYKDKDYAGETEYVRSLIRRHHPQAKTLVDLGCGTGRHAALLAQSGYEVTGVDLSAEMLSAAKGRTPERSETHGATPRFIQGDVRSVRLHETFDVVVSLFHVMSYQTTNQDLKAALSTAREHLAPGGLFIFDCWYGPAVLTDRPAVRIRRLEDDQVSITRLAEPVLHPNRNLVDVKYHVLIRDKRSEKVEELRETHTMRYLFAPEVELLLESCGLRLMESEGFMGTPSLGFESWTGVFVATLGA